MIPMASLVMEEHVCRNLLSSFKVVFVGVSVFIVICRLSLMIAPKALVFDFSIALTFGMCKKWREREKLKI